MVYRKDPSKVNSEGLSDLHTHLLGTGSADFWCHNIIFNHEVLPLNEENMTDKHLPLIWKPNLQPWVLYRCSGSFH